MNRLFVLLSVLAAVRSETEELFIRQAFPRQIDEEQTAPPITEDVTSTFTPSAAPIHGLPTRFTETTTETVASTFTEALTGASTTVASTLTEALTEASTTVATTTTVENATTSSFVLTTVPVVELTTIGALNSSEYVAAEWFGNASIDQRTEFFIKLAKDEIIGARHCKHERDCGVGLTCDIFLNVCAAVADIPKPVQAEFEITNCSLDVECPELHFCLNGTCEFAGPKTCHTAMDCLNGSSRNLTFDCVDVEKLEKHALAIQLSIPVAHDANGHHNSQEEIESDEVVTFGPSAQGDRVFSHSRCWSRCMNDTDCYYPGFPAVLRERFACCSGFCTRKQSCVSVPAGFTRSTTTLAPTTTTIKTTKFTTVKVHKPKQTKEKEFKKQSKKGERH